MPYESIHCRRGNRGCCRSLQSNVGVSCGSAASCQRTRPPPESRPDTAAGPGLVEPVSEEIRVSAQIGGRLDQVLVDEGHRVTAGQVLAIIDNRDYRARVDSARADLALRDAALPPRR